MPLQCRYFTDRILPVSYEWNATFGQPPFNECLQMILIESGCATIRINQQRCYLQSSAIIFRNANTGIEILFSNKLRAKSIAFDPEFINANLSMGNIKRKDYDTLRAKFGYPSFHLFYECSYAYTGVLPLDSLVRPKAFMLFADAINEMDSQPDNRWACRARMDLLELFRLAEDEYSYFMGNEIPATPLAQTVLEYIHTNYEQEITVEMLCELFHTNHTTLLKEFRALTGTTIGQYIVEYKIRLVKEALLFTSLSIEEIAVKYGFKQAAYLSRVFKTRTGLTPGQFRNQMASKRMDAKANIAELPVSHEF